MVGRVNTRCRQLYYFLSIEVESIFMKQDIENLPSKYETESPPNPKRLIGALRQIGYSLEQAFSDLIDNSINAEANNVLIRFITAEDKILSIVLIDDGKGMSEDRLADAMKFGSDEEASSGSLGKYGMGLKLASLSHAKAVTVITKAKTNVYARKWTIEGIEKGWLCDVLDSKQAEKYYSERIPGFDITKSGTLVIWNDIDKLSTSSRGLSATLKVIKRKLKNHLGLCFHRFIEDHKLTIYIDIQEKDQPIHQIRDEVIALNPFNYPVSGHPEYPKKFNADIKGVGRMRFEANIWPANSDLANYKLGGKTSAKQGFYFYRNDRLIQGGGWNGVVQDETEPHGSLARVMIDLPPEYDASFGLNVQKSAVIVPPSFVAGMTSSVADDRDTFSKFRRKADKVYRKKDKGAAKHLPLIPGQGVPKSIINKARALFVNDGGRTRHVDFSWEYFDNGDLFCIDQSNGKILLNKSFRQTLLRGSSGSKSDLPLFKLLVFLLAKEDIDKSRISAKRKEELKIINQLLVQAAKLGKG